VDDILLKSSDSIQFIWRIIHTFRIFIEMHMNQFWPRRKTLTPFTIEIMCSRWHP